MRMTPSLGTHIRNLKPLYPSKISQELRQEIERMQQGGWKYDYEKPLLLDRFLKESARLNPIECSKVIYKSQLTL